MNVLFIHQNFPGQYVHLAAALYKQGHRVVAIGSYTAKSIAGVTLYQYRISGFSHFNAHPWAEDFQTKVLRAEAVANSIKVILQTGFYPDVVVGHSGWGEMLLIKDIVPDVPAIHQVEFVYPVDGSDCTFDQEFHTQSWQSSSKKRLKRATQLMAFHDLDWGLTPTNWQASTVPFQFRDQLSVIHEGIDTKHIRQIANRKVTLQQAGLTFHKGDELVSYVARNLEPYRGFHIFMRMIPILQEKRPNCHIVIVGGDGISYGTPPASGGSWKSALLSELNGKLDESRIHFVGRVPHSVLHDLFRVTACHVYLTYPFVLSWSLLEAMACEATIVASATAPVQEVIQDNYNGLLVDFFDIEVLASTIAKVLERRSDGSLGQQARRSVIENYDLQTICLPKQQKLVERFANGNNID